MGFRFFRRTRIAPGITFNLSKTGASLSLGPRGAKSTVGTSGTRRTLGLPGTGFYYTEHTSRKRPKSATLGNRAPALPAPAQDDRLTLGFFKRLVTPKEEVDFVDGLAALVRGREAEALRHFEQVSHVADAAFLAGVLHLKKGNPKKAAVLLAAAVRHRADRNRFLAKYGVAARIRMAITPLVTAEIHLDEKGLLLALVEALQETGRLVEAVRHLKKLRRLWPGDPLVTLSFVELLASAQPADQRVQKRILELSERVANDSEVHAAILLFRAKALAQLGLDSAACTLLTRTLRRRKGRSDELLRALRYERAAAYERLGETRRARKDLELIYADSPDYEDVADRLFPQDGRACLRAARTSRPAARLIRR